MGGGETKIGKGKFLIMKVYNLVQETYIQIHKTKAMWYLYVIRGERVRMIGGCSWSFKKIFFGVSNFKELAHKT